MTNHEKHDSMMNHIFYALKQGSMNRPKKTTADSHKIRNHGLDQMINRCLIIVDLIYAPA